MAKDSLIKERLVVRDLDPRGLGLLLTASCKTKGRGRVGALFRKTVHCELVTGLLPKMAHKTAQIKGY